jgi:hypothetical protein
MILAAFDSSSLGFWKRALFQDLDMTNARMSAAGYFSTCGAGYLDFYVQIKHIFSNPEASSLFLLGLFTTFLIFVGTRPGPRPLSLLKPVFTL